MAPSTKRSVYKSISWHFVHMTIITTTVLVLTGKLDLAASIVSIHVISETIVYYLHERIWERF